MKKKYMVEELSNKVHHLTKALDTAKSIIKILEEENSNLKNILSSLQSDHTENHDSILVEA